MKMAWQTESQILCDCGTPKFAVYFENTGGFAPSCECVNKDFHNFLRSCIDMGCRCEKSFSLLPVLDPTAGQIRPHFTSKPVHYLQFSATFRKA